MPAGPHLGRNSDYAVVVEGLGAMRSALHRTEATLDGFVRARLKAIAEPIKTQAEANVSHKTGRHGDPHLKPLEDTLKISVTQRFVSVYSSSPYSGVQDRGGRVGHGAILRRAEVSGYLSRAQREGEAGVEAALVELGNEIEAEFER